MNKYIFTLTLLAHTCLVGMDPDLSYICAATLKTGSVTCIALSPDKQRIATGSADGIVHLWDIEKQTCVQELKGHRTPPVSVHFLTDNEVVSQEDGASDILGNIQKKWDLTSGHTLTCFTGSSNRHNPLSFSYTSKKSDVSINASVVRQLERRRYIQLHREQRNPVTRFYTISNSYIPVKHNVTRLALNVDGSVVAAIQKKNVVLWDVLGVFDDEKTTFKPTGILRHTSTVNAMLFKACAKNSLLTGSEDGTIKEWDFPTGTLLSTLTGHKRAVHSLASNHNANLLVSASADETVKVWQEQSKQPARKKRKIQTSIREHFSKK